ncbi:hypothetical protein Mapa_004865 [Marchantia paleacea]|nr:hypothetical protein Mapa_004865 [Marchantia paleacea]
MSRIKIQCSATRHDLQSHCPECINIRFLCEFLSGWYFWGYVAIRSCNLGSGDVLMMVHLPSEPKVT